ncbi:iron-sulfur cluster-binding protein, rieske family [Burkholderia pseudomallei 305]|nr:iron-sulfur cluster-binding protein, rieske family [Burkholderia pseudomallei 305]
MVAGSKPAGPTNFSIENQRFIVPLSITCPLGHVMLYFPMGRILLYRESVVA